MKNRLWTLATLTLVLMTVACASKTVQDPRAPRRFVFPYGTYQHEVDLQLLNAGGGTPPKQFHFKGVASISEQAIKVVALSAMNTTLFRITEDRASGKTETEVYLEALKKVQDRFTDYYGIVRSVLTSPALSDSAGGKITATTPTGEAVIVFRDYDQNHIPGTVDVENAKFRLHIKVTGYEI